MGSWWPIPSIVGVVYNPRGHLCAPSTYISCPHCGLLHYTAHDQVCRQELCVCVCAFKHVTKPVFIFFRPFLYFVKSKIWNRNIDILKEDEVFRVSNFYIILNNFIMNNIVLLKNMWFVSKERITTTWSHIQGNLKYKPSLPCVHNWEKGQKDTTPMLFRTVTLQMNQSYEFP